MNILLPFTEELYYKEEASGISLPVRFTYGANTLLASAKVDTGAEVCLFKYEHAEELGIPLEQGIPKVMKTLAGSLEAFGHEVALQTGELNCQSLVYFAKYPGLPRNILGRQGWLRNLRIAIIDYDNLLYLGAYDS
jgi:hypothetical protein